MMYRDDSKADGISGRVIRPDDAEYEQRVRLLRRGRPRPAAIVRVADANDVSRLSRSCVRVAWSDRSQRRPRRRRIRGHRGGIVLDSRT